MKKTMRIICAAMGVLMCASLAACGAETKTVYELPHYEIGRAHV